MKLHRIDAPVIREPGKAEVNWEGKNRRLRGRCGTPMGCAVLLGAWFLAPYSAPTAVTVESCPCVMPVLGRRQGVLHSNPRNS